ncbi:MAG: DUF5615 family PIN-like protein [Terrimicrobiaceae bacterium]
MYADVHVPGPVILQLRLRGVDIAAATEEGHERLEDADLLVLATEMGRVMVTQDIRFRVLAEHWLRAGRGFAGSFSPTPNVEEPFIFQIMSGDKESSRNNLIQ